MIENDDPKTRCRGHILLAEDDQVVQMVTIRTLEQAAYSVTVVGNGLELIKALTTADYDLVLMDCLMPGMDGFEATRIIRSAESAVRNPEIPIIALTALSAKGDRQRCIRAGMNDYVSKPLDPGLLIAAIQSCLEKSPAVETAQHLQDTPDTRLWNDGFMDTIIDRFLEQVPQVIAELNTAIGEADVIGLKDIGHRLRGSADLIGATSLSARSRALEQSAKTEALIPATECACELIDELQLLVSSLTTE